MYKPMSKSILLPLALVLTFYGVSASAQSASEMLSACRPIAQAPVSNENVAFQQTFESGLCWGAFATIQEVVGYTDENGRLFFLRHVRSVACLRAASNVESRPARW